MNQPYYILAGWLIDGSGDVIRKKVLLEITNGIFTGIGDYNCSDSPDSGLIKDLSHCTILPPFIDSHVHLCMSGTVDLPSRENQLGMDCKELQPLIAKHITDHFSHGILAVRDGGDRQGCVVRHRNEQAGNEQRPVTLKVAGRAWHQRNRYGSLIGRYPADGESLGDAYGREREPHDHVKLVNSGVNSLCLFGSETSPQFSLEEMKSVVVQAKRKGCKVMVHANGRLPVRMAIQAGCHSVEHGYFMGQKNMHLMAENQMFWVPTIYAMKACREFVNTGGMKADDRVVEQNLMHQIEQVTFARKCGVKIALGTDSGSIGVLHGESLVEELKLLIRAGYSLTEVIRCATYHSAQLLNMDNELGCIARGKPAHFLVARGMPAQLPRKLSYLEAIYRDGVPCDFYRK